VESKA